MCSPGERTGENTLKMVKVFVSLLVAFECLSLGFGHAIDLGELEIKMNSILDSEVVEKDLLEKLASKDGSQGGSDSVGILNDLVETSGRMEWLVGLLADLKTLLHQAVDSQQKQLSLRTEVIELREEIKYLREEVQELKAEQVKSETFQQKTKTQTKLENDEKRMEWLTTGLEELRHEIREVSSSINVTTLYHLSQEAENDAKSTKTNMDMMQKELEKLQLVQAQTVEEVVEIRGDMADIRTREIQTGRSEGVTGEEEPRVISFRSELNQVRTIRNGRRGRHDNKKVVRAELNVLERRVEGLLSTTASLDDRLREIEMRKPIASPDSVPEATETDDDKPSSEASEIEIPGGSTNSRLVEIGNQLDLMKLEVGGIGQFQESTQTLFKVLEALETKYDGRMNEFQERLSRLDISNNAISQAQDGLKEQQSAQWRTLRKLKTETGSNGKRQEETHLRLTALQTHILQWGMKTCVNEVKEKAQDVRISALEKEFRGTGAASGI